MKIYKVIQMVVNYGYSLTPTLGPVVLPPSRRDLAGFSGYATAYNAMLAAGYTDPHIMIMFQRWFTYNAHTMGLTATQSWNNVLSAVMTLTQPPPPPLFSPAVIYTVGVAAVILIAKALISPMDFTNMAIDAPDTMYVFANDEAVWLGELIAVSRRGKGLYEMCGDVGGPLIALGKNRPYPPGELDQMWYGGTVMWKGWKFPYFRRYYHMYWWVEYLDVGEWQWGIGYYLKHNNKDPYLPAAPYRRTGGFWGSPTYKGIYTDFPWGLVP